MHDSVTPYKNVFPKPAKIIPADFDERLQKIGEGGGAQCEMCAAFDVSKNTFKKWIAECADFADAVERAHRKSEMWWVKKARENILNQSESSEKCSSSTSLNTSAYQLMMRNMFDYTSKDKEDPAQNTVNNYFSDPRIDSVAQGHELRAARREKE
jgi:hypothetical protein